MSFNFSSQLAKHKKRLLAVLIMALVSPFIPTPSTGSALAKNDEYTVKAAFLYNFMRFVKWPDDSFPEETSPLSICIFGVNPFGKKLNILLKNKRVAGRPISISSRRTSQGFARCHVLFTEARQPDRQKELVKLIAAKPILSVGDTRSFAEIGGMVGFYIDQKRVRFAINPEAIKKADLVVNSQLLDVADLIKPNSREAAE